VRETGGDDSQLINAWNKIGQYYSDRHKWAKAATYYTQVRGGRVLKAPVLFGACVGGLPLISTHAHVVWLHLAARRAAALPRPVATCAGTGQKKEEEGCSLLLARPTEETDLRLLACGRGSQAWWPGAGTRACNTSSSLGPAL